MQEILPECRVWYALMHELLPECRVWMQEILPECREWYTGSYPSAGCGMQELTRVQGVVCRSYYQRAGCGMEKLLPECRVWYAGSYYTSAGCGMQGAITRVQDVVCRELLPE
jgi:hypothetical protein